MKCPHLGVICIQLYLHGTLDSVLIKEVSLFQWCPYREVSLSENPLGSPAHEQAACTHKIYDMVYQGKGLGVPIDFGCLTAHKPIGLGCLTAHNLHPLLFDCSPALTKNRPINFDPPLIVGFIKKIVLNLAHG